MTNWCVWTTLALFAMTFFHTTVEGTAMYKANEVGGRKVHGKYCGDQIMAKYHSFCASGRKRRSALMDESEALNFLRSATQNTYGGTDIVEECCMEGCHHEEIYEYC